MAQNLEQLRPLRDGEKIPVRAWATALGIGEAGRKKLERALKADHAATLETVEMLAEKLRTNAAELLRAGGAVVPEEETSDLRLLRSLSTAEREKVRGFIAGLQASRPEAISEKRQVNAK